MLAVCHTLTVQLAPLDLVVLSAYLVGAVALGLWWGRGQRSAEDYFLGGRSLPWWAVMGSIVATETSTATFLSLPGRSFAEGGDLRFGVLAIGYVIGRVAVAALLLPRYFEGSWTSIYGLLGERFGPATQRRAGAVFLLTRTVGDGLRLFLASLALDEIVGLGLGPSVAVVAAATLLYTVFGGLRSIVWNDCLQLLVYLAGGVLLLVLCVGRLDGGWSELVEHGVATGRWHLFDGRLVLDDPYTLLGGVVGGAFLTLGVQGADQMLVQRMLSARSKGEAALALVVSGFVVAAQFALFLVLGVALSAFFSSGNAPAPDRAVAAFVVGELPAGVGLVGLLLASVLAASMSTLSSSLNSCAASLVSDFLPPSSGGTSLARVRSATVLFAVLQVAVALAAERLSRSVVSEVLAVASFSAGLLLGLFSLCLFAPRATGRSASVGLLVGVVVLCGAQFGLPAVGASLAWTWFPLLGASTVFLFGRSPRLIGSGRSRRLELHDH